MQVAFDVSVTRVGSSGPPPDESDGSIASVMFETDKDGSIFATWIPSEPGFFSVTVKINDQTIANSPRVVTVFDRLSSFLRSFPSSFLLFSSSHTLFLSPFPADENSGRKVKTMLSDPKWIVEGVNVLSYWAGKGLSFPLLFFPV